MWVYVGKLYPYTLLECGYILISSVLEEAWVYTEKMFSHTLFFTKTRV